MNAPAPRGEPAQRQPAAQPPAQPPEQLRYATWLSWGSRAGLAVLLSTFAAYVMGLLPSRVPPAELSRLWGLSVTDFYAATSLPTGWRALSDLAHGDVAAILGVIVLAGVSVPALLALVPLAVRRGDRPLLWLCVAEAVVIVLAASGWLVSGH
jgi:hypothetical protein